MAEATDDKDNSTILLLEEPGLHLHPTAKFKTVKFLKKLSVRNQILYTTHSPFMVDSDHLNNVKIVYEDNKDRTSKVAQDAWPIDKEALFPLINSLGYSIIRDFFENERQVIVEDLADYWILKAMDTILSYKKMISLKNDVKIIPSDGLNKIMPLASTLISNDVKIAILLDANISKLEVENNENNILSNCLFINKYTGKEGGRIEDLLPENYYLKAVKEAYPTIKSPIEFNDEEKKIKNISKRVQTAFNRMKYSDFGKSNPAKIIFDWIHEECNHNGTALMQKNENSNNKKTNGFEDILKEVDNIEVNNYLRNNDVSIQKLPNNDNNGRYLLKNDTLKRFEAIFKELNRILK